MYMPHGMNTEEIKRYLKYRAYFSVLEKEFLYIKRSCRSDEGGTCHHFPLGICPATPVPMYFPLAEISQIGQNPIFIHDFSWSDLDNKVRHSNPKEAMRFRRDLYHLLD